MFKTKMANFKSKWLENYKNYYKDNFQDTAFIRASVKRIFQICIILDLFYKQIVYKQLYSI